MGLFMEMVRVSPGFDEDRAMKLISCLAACDGRGLAVDFERAAVVAELAEVVGERKWTKFISASGLMTARHAYSLRQVHAQFAGEKERWIAANATLTALTVLLPASDRLIRSVQDGMAAGKHYTARALKKLVADETGAPLKTSASRTPARAGKTELEKLAISVVKQSVSEFYERVERIDATIRRHLQKSAGGKATVVKAKLAAAVQLDARAARRIYETAFVRFLPHEHFDGARCFSLATAAGDGMLAARSIIYSLGRGEDWPKGDAATWLEDEVLPTLSWILGRSSAPAHVLAQIIARVMQDPIRRIEWVLPGQPTATAGRPVETASKVKTTTPAAPAEASTVPRKRPPGRNMTPREQAEAKEWLRLQQVWVANAAKNIALAGRKAS
jgi:hypothetical protein